MVFVFDSVGYSIDSWIRPAVTLLRRYSLVPVDCNLETKSTAMQGSATLQLKFTPLPDDSDSDKDPIIWILANGDAQYV